MIRLSMVAAIAGAQARLTRRLVRYWLFVVLSWLAGGIVFSWYAFMHYGLSAFGATFSAINPRYLVGSYGPSYLFVYILLGVVFLGFDVRVRDVRERMSEVLDAKPYSNMELVLGKFAGLLLMSWIPIVVLVLGLLAIGAMIGETIQPFSLFNFLTLMSIPALTLAFGLTFLVSVLVRFRAIAVAVIWGLLAAMVFGSRGIPMYMVGLVDFTGGFQLGYPSDIVLISSALPGLAQRAAYLASGVALLMLTAAFYPRADNSNRQRQVIAATGVLVLAAVLFAFPILAGRSVLQDRQRWVAAHTAVADTPSPDLLALAGEVSIDPGREIRLELTLEFTAPQDASLDRALFSLDPGLEVERVSSQSGAADYSFEDGLLTIELDRPVTHGETRTIEIDAAGSLSYGFAYLDGTIHPMSVAARDANVFILGFDSSMFTDGYIALLPGSRWLPASGSEIGRGDPQVRPRDFFELDLTVELPEGWLAAGPGRRQAAATATADRVRYRFSPGAPVPDVGLVASRFVSRSTEIDGVTFEFLMHPSHAANLELFDDAGDEIADWISLRLDEARAKGLAYPYDAFTLVEVPNALRAFAGGWRLDTALAPPAMVLIKESGFPTARFDRRFENEADFADREGGLSQAKREGLVSFFENDFLGGNLFSGAAANVVRNQTSASGDAALSLDYLCEVIATSLLTGRQSYFSAHIFDAEFNALINQAVARWFQNGGPQGGISVADAVMQTMTSRMEVWDEVLGVSLVELDPWADPRRTLDVLTLKGNAMAHSMLDEIGPDRTGRLLAALLEARRGQSFTRADFIAAGQQVDVDLMPWLDLWLNETDLPGFVLERAEAFRLADDEDGSARYQVLLTVRNGEPVDGLLRVAYVEGQVVITGGPQANPFAGGSAERTEPIRVPGEGTVEIGLLTSKPTSQITIEPYLSLNREPFRVDVPPVDEEKTREQEPFSGARVVDWAVDDTWIVIDDLDPGFEIAETEGGRGLRIGASAADGATDHGLPVAIAGAGAPSRWSRRTDSLAFGRYRHTMALIGDGEGRNRAIFAAELPGTGEWELELHIPQTRFVARRNKTANWQMAIESGAGREPLTFEASAAVDGWNSLGIFSVEQGEVRVELTDETEGRMVIADAIRWRPARGGSTDQAALGKDTETR